MSKSKSTRSGFKAQASALAHESKGFIGARSRTTAYRSATYKPTLEKFQSTSFSDYVRAILMGVPLHHVEKEDAHYPGDSDDDDDDDDRGDSKKCECGEELKSSGENNENSKYGPLKILKTKNSPKQKKETPQDKSPRRMTTRSQTCTSYGNSTTSGKENRFGRVYPSSPPLKKNKLSENHNHRPKYKCDQLKLSDGVSKITPPFGWWDKAGIGKDTTARGAPWQKGEKLGDLIIPGSIKQCVAGIGGVYDFTMMELPPITVAAFREKADIYRKSQMGNEIDEDESDEHMDLLARKFWKRIGPTMQSSQYGADMEGTLFDGAEACGWNVDKLDSCLALLEADYKDADEISEDFKLPGVTSAYLYFGMWASVFSAHTEDMNLLSINYLHAGAPKYWYAIAEEDSGRFESLMKSMFSHQANECPEFLRHKRSLISPHLLTKAGISYTTQVQRAGDIMITFPGSYHFGFNTGFNVAESTNFAVPEWIDYGFKAKICMCHPHSVRLDIRRFRTLLNKCEDDLFGSDGRISYGEWAKNFIRSKQRTNEKQEVQVENGKIRKGKPLHVEVMKLSSARCNQGKKKSSRRKRKSADVETVDFRLAKPMKLSNLIPQTRVICLLETDSGGECYFGGSIVDVVERHAKIHFSGSSRNEDIWLTIDSGKLLLDGGAIAS